MALSDLFGTAKETVKRGKQDVKKGERKALDVYRSGSQAVDRGVAAHKRGASEVGERFGRANEEAGEYASEVFGLDEEPGMGGDGMGVDVGMDDDSDRQPVMPGAMMDDSDDRDDDFPPLF